MRSHVTWIALAVVMVALACPSAAWAATTYTYTGNNFDTIVGTTYTTSMSVSGSFTTSAPLPRNLPLTDIIGNLESFNFVDGVQTRNDANSFIIEFEAATDADGQISGWKITVVALPIVTTIGEIRTLIDTRSPMVNEQDIAGEGQCSEVVNGMCVSFALHDYGQLVNSPGGWVRTGDVPPTSVTYSYEGNSFDDFGGGSYSPGDRVQAEFTLATPLAPNMPLTDISDALISFIVSDGVQTRTITDSYVPNFELGTDSSGAIDEWFIFVVEGPPATTTGEIRHNIHTAQTPSNVADIGGIGECNNVVNGICVGFANTDYGQIFDDPGDWDGPPSSPSSAGYTYIGNNYTYTEGPSYDLSMFLSGSFTTAEPLPSSMAYSDITHTVTAFDFFDGVQTRTMVGSWGWVFKAETDANGDIFRWQIHIQEEPEVTTVGEVRHLIDSYSVWRFGSLQSDDQAGTGHCSDVIGGTCVTFILDDYGSADWDPGTWRTTVTSLTNPIPTLSVWGAVIMVFFLATLGIIRLWRL